MKKTFVFIAFLLISIQTIIAKEIDIDMDVPSGTPDKMSLDRYVPRSLTHAFFEKWADSIRSKNQEITIKTLDKQYIGIGLKHGEELEYFPDISLTNDKNVKDCTLYSGIVSEKVYSHLTSPMLYDSKNKICVAVTGKRVYDTYEYPYYYEPKELESIVYVWGLLPEGKKKLELREVVLLPQNLSSKESNEYIKKVKKLYKKNSYENPNSFKNQMKNLGNEFTKNAPRMMGDLILRGTI